VVYNRRCDGKGLAAISEIKRANDWGLDARDFDLNTLALGAPGAVVLSPESVAQSEIVVAQAVLKYGRFARGGRIINPAEQLSSYLDRRPQLLDPKLILERLATTQAPDEVLRALHPQHPQFEKLRQAYLATTTKGAKGKRAGGDSVEAKRLLANMEQWRWMPADLGQFYVWNNVPEYTQRVVKSGDVIQSERIVAGELGKQTPIFSRPMRRVTFKPTWKVPDSIKAKELWPNLLRGGSLMTSWALQVQTKDGQIVDWRKIDWSKTDILNYDVIQVTGPKNVLGKVKFSFPNPHTVFMHDTLERDKYLFNIGQRTFSHGCMRVRNPMKLAEALLAHDKGWTPQQVNEAYSAGPLNNEIALDQKIPVHTTYFTAWVGADGKVQTARDSYGHERRIMQALEGKWSQIVRGRDHLAPVAVNLAAAQSHKKVGPDGEELPAIRVGATSGRQRGIVAKPVGSDFFGSLFGGF
jgi:L,D-transpeptidase YcbB